MGLDTVETIIWAEKEFGIEIPDADAAVILSIGQFSAYIHNRLASAHSLNSVTEKEIFERIKHYLISYFKLKEDSITREAEFVKDLGLW